jgi:hypothetical protein
MKKRLHPLFLSLHLFLVILFMCTYQFACAQTVTGKANKESGNAFVRLNRKIVRTMIKEPKPFCDTNYVKTFGKVFTIGLPVSSKMLRMEFGDRVSENSLLYYPSTVYSPGLFINTRLFGFYITPAVLGIHQNRSKTGRSNFNDYQFNMYGKRFFYDINFQSYSGFYLKNTGDFKEYQSLVTYYKRQDLDALAAGFNVYYVFNNRKFSYRGAFSFTQSQIKSAGSFITGTYFSTFAFTADSSVVGSQVKESFKQFATMKSGTSVSSGLSFGYAYTFVLNKRFYISTSVIPGLGFNKINVERTDSTVFSGGSDVSLKINYRFAVGYDDTKWFYGFSFLRDDYYSLSSNAPVEINYHVGKFRVFVGRRFNGRKIEDKILKRFKIIS